LNTLFSWYLLLDLDAVNVLWCSTLSQLVTINSFEFAIQTGGVRDGEDVGWRGHERDDQIFGAGWFSNMDPTASWDVVCFENKKELEFEHTCNNVTPLLISS
jgi:hypothetical protein